MNYIIASIDPPFTVFGAPYSTGCPAQAISVDSSGALRSVVANLTYDNGSGVHGLAVSRDNRFVYSADDMGSSVWTHLYDPATNKAAVLQRSNVTGNPRHVVVSPQGHFVYVVLEETNQLAVFDRDETSGLIGAVKKTFALIPSGMTHFGVEIGTT